MHLFLPAKEFSQAAGTFLKPVRITFAGCVEKNTYTKTLIQLTDFHSQGGTVVPEQLKAINQFSDSASGLLGATKRQDLQSLLTSVLGNKLHAFVIIKYLYCSSSLRLARS